MTDDPSDGPTLWDRWEINARLLPDHPAIVHWRVGDEPFRWTRAGLLTAARKIAALLLARDIKKGDVCALIIRHDPHLYPLYMALVHIGAIPTILAYPNPRLHPDKFRQGLEGMAQRSGLDWILTERALEDAVRPLVERGHSTVKGLLFPFEWETQPLSERAASGAVERRPRPITGADLLLLQHSSGTTGLQKPIALSHRAVWQHIDDYGTALGLKASDKVVSWLPLYHDMGLIAAFHLPLALGITTIQIDAFDWVRIPALLLDVVSQERASVSWLPNFAYNLMADKISEADLSATDLTSWRLIINCSEPVRHDSHLKFIARFRSRGLDPAALCACYAMAETTFAATQTPPGRTPAVLAADRSALARGRIAIAPSDTAARICVSSGRAIPGCRLRIVDAARRDVAAGAVGEIAVASASLFDGYRNYPEKTAAVLHDGWYYSGDLGFLDGDDLYVIGRAKDLIIVAGNNIYPEDIEDAVSQVPGIIPGRVVAFGEEDPELGSERIAVIAETAVQEAPRRAQLLLAVVQAGMAIDATISKVYLVAPRWLIKSSSGKPSRRANKERILSEGQPSDRR